MAARAVVVELLRRGFRLADPLRLRMNELPWLSQQRVPTGGTRPRHPENTSAARSRRARRPLADLAAGHEGRIAGLRLGEDAQIEDNSPLRVGARVYVVESTGHGWQHVRIGFREYSVPRRVAERVEVDALPSPQLSSPAAPSPAAGDDTALTGDGAARDGTSLARAAEQYEVLLTRRRRTIWRVLVVHRGGTVVRSLLFDDRHAARALWSGLREEAESMTVTEFRARHGLP